MTPDIQTLLQEVLNNALRSLYANDPFLIEHDVNERSISHRLAMYIQAEMNNQISGWHVDCEYNRLGAELVNNHWRSKTLNLPVIGVMTDDTKAKTVYPDINIHHRGKEGEEHNLLVIEIKKCSPTDIHDFKKLEEYGKQLDYQWGVFLNIESKKTTGHWWKKGDYKPNLENHDYELFYTVVNTN